MFLEHHVMGERRHGQGRGQSRALRVQHFGAVRTSEAFRHGAAAGVTDTDEQNLNFRHPRTSLPERNLF